MIRDWRAYRRNGAWHFLRRRQYRLAVAIIFLPAGWVLLPDTRTHITDWAQRKVRA